MEVASGLAKMRQLTAADAFVLAGAPVLCDIEGFLLKGRVFCW